MVMSDWFFEVLHVDSCEWLKPTFGSSKKGPFPLNRDGPLMELQIQRLYEHFSGNNVVSMEWRCSLSRGVTKERFHCT